MHYHVLLNEAKVSNDEIFTFLYEHSYQFMRSTTPVSQHPAIYYAHLAAGRATPHDPKWSGSSDTPVSAPQGRPRSGSGSKSQSGSQAGGRGGSGGKGSSSGAPVEFDKLLAMPNQGGIASSMWYI